MTRYVLCSFLIVLLVQCASILGATAGDCGVHGEVQTDDCVCYSGYAPSTTANQDCSLTVLGTCTWENSSSTYTGGAATLTDANFASNILNLNIQSHIVINRTITSISIGSSSDPACVYPGVNFEKSLGDCTDSFTGQIPWATANTNCNFVEDDTDPDLVQYAAPIYVTSTQVSDLRGHQVTQTQTDVLHIVVQFQKQISISTSTTVVAPVNMFSTVTDQSYSPVTERGSVSFATSLQWPFTLQSGVFNSMPAGLSDFGDGTIDATADSDCSDTEGSSCYQVFSYEIVPGTVCQLTGQYVIEFVIACRGTDPCPLDASTNTATLTLSLQSADFCAAVDTGVTATAEMTTYSDEAHTAAKTAFFLEQIGYFLVDVSSAQAEVSQAVISAVSVTVGGTPTSLYTSAGGIANSVLTSVNNGADTSSFAVNFTSSLFDVPTDQELQYSFTVDIQVGFDGNGGTKKRSIITRSAPAASSTRASSQVSLQAAPSNIQIASAASTTKALIGGIVLLSFLLFLL